MSVSDYFITPKDIAHAFKWRYILGVFVAIGAAIGLAKVGAGLDMALFISSIIAVVIWKLDARIPFGLAIACFVAIMVISIVAPDLSKGTASQAGASGQLAVAAFFCLVAGVALLVREQFEHPKPKQKVPQHLERTAPPPEVTLAAALPAQPKPALATPRPVVVTARRPNVTAAAPTTVTPQAGVQPAATSATRRAINDVMRPTAPLKPRHTPIHHSRPKLVQL